MQGRIAFLDVAGDVLDHDDGVVDHEAGGNGQRHQRKIVEAETEQIHGPERADQRQRNGKTWDQRCPRGAQEHEDHHHHQHDRERQFVLDVAHRGADGDGPVGQDVEVDRRRQRGLQLRQQRLDALDHGNDVGAGLPLDIEDDRRGLVHPGAELFVLRAIDDVPDVAETDGRAVLVGDDQGFVIAGVADLVIGIDRVGAHPPVEVSLRRVDVGVGKGGAQVIDVEPVGGELADIGTDPHRGPLAAADADEANAWKLGDFLRQPGVDEILHLCERHSLGRQAHRQDRRVRRIHLGVDRRRRQVGGQEVARGIDGGLHLLLGDIERNTQSELQRDDRCAGGAHRAHLVEVWHLAELHLQRGGDGGGHHIGTGTGIEGLDLNGRIIDFRQGGHGKEAERQHARQHDGDHQQRRCHRPHDERL